MSILLLPLLALGPCFIAWWVILGKKHLKIVVLDVSIRSRRYLVGSFILFTWTTEGDARWKLKDILQNECFGRTS